MITDITKHKIEAKDSKFSEFNLSTDIVRLAGNLVHANKGAQDFLMDKNFLYFYLAHTNRDDSNPYCKEATVVFIKYMTKDNDRASQYIS